MYDFLKLYPQVISLGAEREGSSWYQRQFLHNWLLVMPAPVKQPKHDGALYGLLFWNLASLETSMWVTHMINSARSSLRKQLVLFTEPSTGAGTLQ